MEDVLVVYGVVAVVQQVRRRQLPTPEDTALFVQRASTGRSILSLIYLVVYALRTKCGVRFAYLLDPGNTQADDASAGGAPRERGEGKKSIEPRGDEPGSLSKNA